MNAIADDQVPARMQIERRAKTLHEVTAPHFVIRKLSGPEDPARQFSQYRFDADSNVYGLAKSLFAA